LSIAQNLVTAAGTQGVAHILGSPSPNLQILKIPPRVNHQKLMVRRTDPIIKSSTFEVPSAQSSTFELSNHQKLMVLQILSFRRRVPISGTPPRR
jgi:hypothetical protein